MNGAGDSFLLGFLFGFVMGFVVLLFLAMAWLFAAPWFKAFLSGAGVPLVTIIAMRLRGSPVKELLNTYIALIHSGHAATIRDVESTYLANRHRLLQPRDLYDLLKQELPAAASKASTVPTPPR